MIFRRFPQKSLEALFLSALGDGYDGAIREWLASPYRITAVRNAVASLTRDEALGLISRGGEARIAALTEHPDGRVREAALRSLTPAGSLPTLLGRANDWVPIVARLAGERALAALPQAGDETLLQSLPLVFALTRQGRANHATLVTAFLHQARVRRGLARRIRLAYRNGPVGEWASWRVVGEEESAHDLVQERLRTGTPRLQFQTARQVAAEPGRWRELLASRNPQVRRIALDHAPPEAIEAALGDANAGVRNDARYLLGKRDYAAYYRGRLSEPVKLPFIARVLLDPVRRETLERHLFPNPGVVSGLGETGSRSDAEALRPLLSHPKSDVRARAVEAIFRLLGDDAEALLLAMLRDPVRKVQRAAVAALVLSNAGLDPEDVLRWPLTVALRLRLLQRTPRWAALLAVLRESAIFEGAEDWLIKWAQETAYGRVPPKPNELTEARTLLHEAQDRMRPGTATALRDALGAWR